MTINAFDSATWPEEEEFYFDYVDAMLRKRRDILISNGRPLHAVYLLNAFFRNAKKTIRLFSGSLSRTADAFEQDKGMPIYSDPYIINAVRTFLSSSKSNLKIVLENDIDVEHGASARSHPLVGAVLDLKEKGLVHGEFHLRRINPDTLRRLRAGNFCQHLMIMDDWAYRLETDASQARAHVNFGDRGMTGLLSGFFDEIILSRQQRHGGCSIRRLARLHDIRDGRME